MANWIEVQQHINQGEIITIGSDLEVIELRAIDGNKATVTLIDPVNYKISVKDIQFSDLDLSNFPRLK